MSHKIEPLSTDEFRTLILNEDERTIGSLYALKKRQGGGLFLDTLTVPHYDTSAMTVRMCISTEDIDRQGHVILQNGIKKDNYALNPVVLWDHGEDYAVPVAMSEDGQKQLTVETIGSETFAVAHHQRSNEMSCQLFDAVVCGLLRASSIGVQPLSAGKMYREDGSEILVVELSDMFEWSYTAVGVQPRAVRRSISALKNDSFLEAWALQCESASKILSRGTLDGRPILGPIRKALTQILRPTASQEPGYNPKEPIMKKLTTLEIRKMNTKQLLKSLGNPGKFDEATVKAMQEEAMIKSEMEAGDAPATGEVVESEVPAEVPDETPLGAKVVSSAHDELLKLIGVIETAMGPVENPTIKDSITEQLNMLRECVTAFEGLYSSAYPDLPGLAIETPVEDEMVKSFLAQSRYSTQLGGLTSRIMTLAKSITGKQQAALMRTASELDRLNKLSKAYKPAPQESNSELEKKVDEFVSRIQTKLGEITKIMDETPAKVR